MSHLPKKTLQPPAPRVTTTCSTPIARALLAARLSRLSPKAILSSCALGKREADMTEGATNELRGGGGWLPTEVQRGHGAVLPGCLEGEHRGAA